jgi:hypothetical protein
MRAFMSRKDEYAADPLRSPVSNLKPDLFPSDMAWVVAQSVSEARAILAETEPQSGERDDSDSLTVVEITNGAFVGHRLLWNAERALGESLSAFVNE